MTDMEKRTAAAWFAANWKDRGDEKQETNLFWIVPFPRVYGVEEPDKHIAFELPVKLDHTSFIDGYIESTRVLFVRRAGRSTCRGAVSRADEDVPETNRTPITSPYQRRREHRPVHASVFVCGGYHD